MQKRRAILFLLLAGLGLAPVVAEAQATLSLKEAIDKALQSNLNIKAANYDLQKTQEQVKETSASLYPQVDVKGSYQYYLKLPQTVFDLSAFPIGGGADTLGGGSTPVSNNNKYAVGTLGLAQSASATGQLTQQLYNGQLLIGLKAAKVATRLNELQIRATKEDIVYNVSATYYNLQTIDRSLAIQQKNLENQDRLIANMKLQLDNGITNKTAYNRLLVKRTTAAAQIENTRNTRIKTFNLMKYLLAVDINSEFSIDSLEDNSESLSPLVSIDRGSADNRADLKLLEEQKTLNILDKKSIQATYLPVLSASVNYGYTGYYDKFAPFTYRQVTDASGTVYPRFFPSSALQVNLNIPVFDGFRRKSQVAQKSIDIQQTQNSIELKRQTIDKELADAGANYNSYLATLRSSEENRVMAEKIYADMQLQYRNGIVSLNDVLQAQNDMNDAQTTYVSSLINLRTAELDLKKSRGELLNY